MTICKPLNDTHCLGQLVHWVQLQLSDSDKLAIVDRYTSLAAVVTDLRHRPQTSDRGYRTYPHATRLHCIPRQRLRFFPPDPNCFERTGAYLVAAERFHPEREYTLATTNLSNGRALLALHTFPIVLQENNPIPVVLDPVESALTRDAYQAVTSQFLGYGATQPHPQHQPVQWAEWVATLRFGRLPSKHDICTLAHSVAPFWRDGLPVSRDLSLARFLGNLSRTVEKPVVTVAQAAASPTGQRVLGMTLRQAIIAKTGPLGLFTLNRLKRYGDKEGISFGALTEPGPLDTLTTALL